MGDGPALNSSFEGMCLVGVTVDWPAEKSPCCVDAKLPSYWFLSVCPCCPLPGAAHKLVCCLHQHGKTFPVGRLLCLVTWDLDPFSACLVFAFASMNPAIRLLPRSWMRKSSAQSSTKLKEVCSLCVCGLYFTGKGVNLFFC